jgi:hypothetical protein
MPDVSATEYDDELSYEGGGLPKTGNWWSAFVIGLAGTILVTGIAPTMVTSLGAAAIPTMFLITLSGWLLCLFLAELAAMMPDRSGGSPTYAYVAFKDRWPKFAGHVNGITAWGYWLGWFPVAPLNMILASFYIANLFKLNTTAGISLLGTKIAWWTIAISVIGILLLFIPSYRGLRFGTFFATALALLSMIPLTFLAISWIFHPSVVDFSQLTHFRHTDGSGFFAPTFGHGWLTISIAFSFLLTWNVIAMEAAACYIGETRDPDRDAKIAMNLEGGYGVFIYTMIPIAFVIVLGVHALGGVRDQQGLDRARRPDRDHADPGADPVRAQRHHRHGALAAPDVLRRALPQVLLEDKLARRPGPLDGVQRGLRDHRRVHGRGGADLHVLERRLPVLVHPGADRLLLPTSVAPERTAAVPAARVDEVRGACARVRVRGHLRVGRPRVRLLYLLTGG